MRSKRVLKNLITDILPMLLISFLGIFKFKLFVKVLGQETQGMYQLFTQIMIYISVVDGGLGSAVLHALYRPNTDNNQEQMNAILSGAKKVFSKLGILVYAIAFLASFFVPLLIKDNPFEYTYVILTFLLFALSSVINYFFIPYQCLLEVKEERYVYNTIYQIGQILQSVLEIALLLMGMDFLLILFMHSVVRLGANAIIAIIAKKRFPQYNYHSEKKDYNFRHQIKHLMFHKINGLVGSNIDVLIITRFLGLTATNVYSTYNYIVNMVKQMMEKISSATLAILGNILSVNKEQAYKLFRELNSMMFYIATCICVPLLLAINSFIDIWYEEMIETNWLIAGAFSGILFMTIVKIAITVFVHAAGLFEQTKKCAIADTIINLILSFVLVQFMGISGVLIATGIAVFVAEYIMKTLVIHKEIFECSSKTYFVRNIKFWVIALVDIIIGYKVISYFDINHILVWFLVFAVYTVVNGVVILLIYKLFRETEFLKRFTYALKRRGITNEG